MLVKINKKPIKIEEETDNKEFDYALVCVNGLGTLIVLYLMDCIAYSFLYIHPFPFTKFIGVIISWLN